MSFDPAMLAPVQRLARFMASGEDAGLAEAFAASDVVILENFAPFRFEGPDAVERWRQGFLDHARRQGLAGLAFRFGEAQDLAREADQAFFTLPTAWTGRARGQPFSEDGGWAFVLVLSDDGAWRIRSYAWAVVSKA